MAWRRAKASLGELLLWDAILLGVAVGLTVYEGHDRVARADRAREVNRKQAGKSAEKTSRKSPQAPRGGILGATGLPGTGTPGAGATGLGVPGTGLPDTTAPKLDPQAAALAKLRERAQGRPPAQALEVWEEATGSLREHTEWKREVASLRAGLLAKDLAIVHSAELGVLADLGRVQAVRKGLAALPTEARRSLQGELARAQSVQSALAKKPKAKALFTAYSPDQVTLKGQLCTIECALGKALAQTLRDEVDDLLRIAQRLRGTSLTKRGKLTLVISAAGSPPARGGARKRVSAARKDEPAAATAARARLCAARWAADLVAPAAPALGQSLARALASGAPHALTPYGAAWRRLFLASPKPQVRNALGQSPAARPLGWALVFTACHAPGAADLRGTLREACRRGESTLRRWLTGTRALAVESLWARFVKEAQ